MSNSLGGISASLGSVPWSDGGNILVCSGEDSGDLLLSDALGELCGGEGSHLVQNFRGTWGFRTSTILRRPSLLDLEKLAVNGITDVLWRAPGLLWQRHLMARWLGHPACRGFVGVDYPGFNLPLMQRAKRLNKGRLLVAPPQIWAWKPQRGRYLRDEEVVVFFPFEVEIWQNWGAKVQQCRHPALDRLSAHPIMERKGWLLQPGSRLGTLKRNLPLFVQYARYLRKQEPHEPVEFAAANPQVRHYLQGKMSGEFSVRLTSGGRSLQGARGCITVPGTSALEAALAGCPTLVTSRLDTLTWYMGRAFLRVPHLSLPNLLLGERFLPEAIFKGHKVPLDELEKLRQRHVQEFSQQVPRLRQMLDGPSLGRIVVQCAQGW